MKVQNKIFKTFISAALLINLLVPNFAFAEEVVLETTPEAVPTETPLETVQVVTGTTPITEEKNASENTVVEVEQIQSPESTIITEESTTESENSVTEVKEVVVVETVAPETSTSTPETQGNSEPVMSSLMALPDPSSRLVIRVGDSIIATDYYSPGPDPITVTDNMGATRTINQNSVLAMLVEIDRRNENFAITDLGYYSAFDSFIINCITANSTASCYNWQYTVNDTYLSVGVDDAVLTDNSEVYLYFGQQNRFTITDDSVTLNEPIIVHAEKYDYKNNLWTFRPSVTVGATVTNPADPWTPIVVTSTKANEYGQAKLYLTATGTIQIGIAEDYYYPTLPVTARLAETTITLNIQTPAGEFFKQNVSVISCPTALNSPVYTLNAWCAVEQTATTNNWTATGNWFGSDVFLDKINDYQSDFAANKFWGWYHDLNAGQTGLNGHILTENEEILLTYGVNPLKIELQAPSPLLVQDSVTINILEQDFSDWNIFPAPWKNLTTSSTLYINGEPIELGIGTYSFVATNGHDPYIVKATKAGYAPSNELTFGAEFGSRETEEIPTTNGNSGGSGGGTTPTNSAAVFNVNSAAEYLYSQQKANGAIGSGTLYSDWAAIAIGTLGNSDAKNNLSAYLKTDPNPGTTATDYERRAMALLALGINPYSDTKTNYIAKIIATYDGTQFGDTGLVNDDIFALFPLLKAGYSTSDSEIQKSVAFILSKQNSAGGFESPDMTAAAVQALSQVKSIAGVNEALVKAKNYLKLSTKTDGRIGDNDFSTSWGLQALTALGESVESWNGANTSPLSYLATQQQSDGGIQPSTASTDNRIWSTSYAIPAVQGKTWSSILSSVSKPSTAIPITPVLGIDTSVTPTINIPTSTPIFVTSTPETVTTKPVIIPTPEILVINVTPEPILPVTTEAPVSDTIVQKPTQPSNSTVVANTQPKINKTQTNDSNEAQVIANNSDEQLTTPNFTEEKSEAKKMLQGAAAMAGTAGAYLAWRFIQSLA